MPANRPSRPTEVSEETTWFDRAADRISRFVAKASFFVICVVFALAWAASGPIVGFPPLDRHPGCRRLAGDVHHRRPPPERGVAGNKAAQRKLNAIASAPAELMKNADVDQEHVRQLEAAVGLEKRESSTR